MAVNAGPWADFPHGRQGYGGIMGSAPSAPQVVQAEETVTPAVAKSVGADVNNAVQNQQNAKRRLRGIRSTYASLAKGDGGTTGSAQKLG